MEASQAGLAGGNGDAGQQGEAQGGGGADLSQFGDTLSQLAQTQQEMKDFLSSQPWQPPQPDPEPEPDPLAGLFEDPAGPDPYDPQQFASALDKALDQRLQASIKPAMERAEAAERAVQEYRTEAEAQALVQEFPELGNPETQKQVFGLAQEIITANGLPQELMDKPAFWRMTYLTAKAAEQANTEQAGAVSPGQAAHLEGGAGATPGGAQQVGTGWENLGGARGAGALPF
jgi:hypothetical protein